MFKETLFEKEEYRSENGNHYVQNNRTTKVVFTAQASNYYYEHEQKFKKIDNTLVEDMEY